MKVTVNDQTYGVRWKHTLPENERDFPKAFRKSGSPIHPFRGGTKCSIFLLTPNRQMLVSQGESRVYHTDQFNKDTGRKISMTRALDNLSIFNRSTRRKFWEAYFSRNGIKEQVKVN